MAEIFFRPRAFRAAETLLSKAEQEKLNSLLNQLRNGTFPPNAKKLQDIKHGYRLRIGRWRVLFSLISQTEKIEVVDIFMEKGGQDYRRRQKIF